MSRKKAFVFTLALGLIGVLVFWLAKPKEEFKTLDIGKAKTEVLSGSHSSGERNPKIEPLNYFIAGVMEGNVDIFLSSFYPQTISTDLFLRKVNDKSKVTEEIMNNINRNGTLSEVKYKENRGYFNSETNSMTLFLKYKDQSKAEVILEIVPLTSTSKVYTIKTSSRDIINQIKRRTK